MYGKNDQKAWKVREKMCDIMYKAGQLDSAIEELRRVEVAKRGLFGENSAKVGKVCKKLAGWLLEAKRESEAKEYLARAGHIMKQRRTVRKNEGWMDSGSERNDNMSKAGNSEPGKGDASGSSGSGSSPGKGPRKAPVGGKKAKRIVIRKT